jgi:HTH-type transcriptional regulator/antitoxin HipB
MLQRCAVEYVACNAEQLAKLLKSTRRRRRLTQATVGSWVGVGQSHLSVIEGHGAKATIGTLYKLLSVLNLELVLRDAATAPASRRTAHPPASAGLVRAGEETLSPITSAGSGC